MRVAVVLGIARIVMVTTGMCLATIAVSADAVRAQTPPRVFRPSTWLLIGGVPATAELLNPSMVKAAGDRVVVYDHGSQQVKTFTFDGKLVWKAGRPGQGPGEFTNATDLQVGPNGTIWVTDSPNFRVTILSPDGSFARFVRLPLVVNRAIPISMEQFWGVSYQHASFVQRMDTAGTVLERVPSPSWLRDLHQMSKEAMVAGSLPDRIGVVGFYYSDRWLVLEDRTGRTTVAERRGVEAVELPSVVTGISRRGGGPFTRIDPRARAPGRAFDIHRGRVFVLVGGTAEGPTDLVDSYDLRTGSYVRSYRLPQPVHRLAVGPGGEFVAMVADPEPAIRIWRSPDGP